MASDTIETLIAFGTDNVGLERIFRLLQALSQLLLFQPFLFRTLLDVLSLHPKIWSRPMQTTLIQLRTRLGLTRRLLRLFRFADSLRAGYLLAFSGPAGAGPRKMPVEVWLDVLHRTFMGLYGLLESATVPDLLEVNHLSVWGGERTRMLNLEAQRFWFLALACSVASGLFKLVKVFAYAPVPEKGSGYGTGEEGRTKEAEKEKQGSEKQENQGEKEKGTEEDEAWDWRKERERLRGIVARNKARRRAWIREVKKRFMGLLRRVVVDALDMVIPGSMIGWIHVEQSTVALVMLVTTVLTGMEVWERCQLSVRARRAAEVAA